MSVRQNLDEMSENFLSLNVQHTEMLQSQDANANHEKNVTFRDIPPSVLLTIEKNEIRSRRNGEVNRDQQKI